VSKVGRRSSRAACDIGDGEVPVDVLDAVTGGDELVDLLVVDV
jgi:hypothetical protein